MHSRGNDFEQTNISGQALPRSNQSHSNRPRRANGGRSEYHPQPKGAHLYSKFTCKAESSVDSVSRDSRPPVWGIQIIQTPRRDVEILTTFAEATRRLLWLGIQSPTNEFPQLRRLYPSADSSTLDILDKLLTFNPMKRFVELLTSVDPNGFPDRVRAELISASFSFKDHGRRCPRSSLPRAIL